MNVGVEISDLLYPHGAGVYTYGFELVKHLALLDDVSLTLIGADHGYARRAGTRSGSGFPPVREVWARVPVPLLGATNGRWKNDYRTRRLVYGLDEHLLRPLARLIDTRPSIAKYRLPRDVRSALQVCHWPDSVFVKLPGAAHVATVHDAMVLRSSEWHTPYDAHDLNRRLRRTARHATRIIADSDSTRRDLVTLLGVASDRIDVIPLAAAPDFRPPRDAEAEGRVLQRYGLDRGQYILYVGTIEPRKNLVRLAEAFKVALERIPHSPMRLVFAGKHGWMTDPIDRGLEAQQLGDRLTMLGRVPREDLPSLMHAARAVAYVSLYEGFGLPPLEAMACGAPVLASNTTSIPEVVGNAGLLVDPENVRGIAEALYRIMADDALRDRLAQQGFARSQLFSWEKTTELTVETYRRAAAMVGYSRHRETGAIGKPG